MSARPTDRTEHDTDIEAFLDSIDPATLRDARHLRAIATARKGVAAAEVELRKAVDDARAAGDSWTMIGLMLGTSKQAAHRKFGRTGHS